MFLAMMELIRHHGAKAEQEGLFSEIWLFAGENPRPLEDGEIDDYAPHSRAAQVHGEDPSS
jgi:hypothetical protein